MVTTSIHNQQISVWFDGHHGFSFDQSRLLETLIALSHHLPEEVRDVYTNHLRHYRYADKLLPLINSEVQHTHISSQGIFLTPTDSPTDLASLIVKHFPDCVFTRSSSDMNCYDWYTTCEDHQVYIHANEVNNLNGTTVFLPTK